MIKFEAVRGRRLHSQPCAIQPEISNGTQREIYVPSAIAHYVSTERVCWNSAKVERSKVSRRCQRARRTTYASAPKSHHLRERVGAKLIQRQVQERTDSGGLRRCMGQKGNAFAIERSARWQNWLSGPYCAVRKNLCAPVQLSGSLCVFHHTPLPIRMMNITSRPVIVAGPRRPCLLVGLLGLGLKRVSCATQHKLAKLKIKINYLFIASISNCN